MIYFCWVGEPQLQIYQGVFILSIAKAFSPLAEPVVLLRKEKLCRRYERNDGIVYMSPTGMTYDDFYFRNDAVTAARDQYLRGEITAEETLKIIKGKD